MKVNNNPPLCFITFVFPNYTVHATVSESHLSTCGKCWPWKCQVLVNKTRSTLRISSSICTPIFSLFITPHACSIILHIGLSNPRAPRKVGKSKRCRRKVQLHTKKRACMPPWPLRTMATALTCTPIVWVWSPRPSLTWSPPSPCALIAWPDGFHSLQTWVAPCWSTCLLLRRRLA
jgi:hypothetical protein